MDDKELEIVNRLLGCTEKMVKSLQDIEKTMESLKKGIHETNLILVSFEERFKERVPKRGDQ